MTCDICRVDRPTRIICCYGDRQLPRRVCFQCEPAAVAKSPEAGSLVEVVHPFGMHGLWVREGRRGLLLRVLPHSFVIQLMPQFAGDPTPVVVCGRGDVVSFEFEEPVPSQCELAEFTERILFVGIGADIREQIFVAAAQGRTREQIRLQMQHLFGGVLTWMAIEACIKEALRRTAGMKGATDQSGSANKPAV